MSSSIVADVRDFTFIMILLAMAGLGAWHLSTQSWVYLSIDIFIALYAFAAWNPFKRRRR